MLLDYHFNKRRQELSFSYITENGGKALLKYQVGKFKHHQIDHNGPLTNWDGRKVSEVLVDNPNAFDIRLFIEGLPQEDKDKLFANNFPRVWSFDIEVDYEEGVFPDPQVAYFPILTIAVVDDRMNTLVLGTDHMKSPESVGDQIYDYIQQSEFYRGLHMDKPRFSFVHFDSEKGMLEYFLKTIVSKVPILAGWNSLLFDWQYIQNRINSTYPDLSLTCSSCIYALNTIQKYDLRDQKIRLSVPRHTSVLDMMDIVGSFDMAVMPQKESLSLEYIASESPVGLGKIKYDGDLKQLYETDYDKYIFYNAIDSILVQLIDKCFRTLNNLYTQANYTKIPIEKAMSKIALSDALFWDYFRSQNLAVVPVDRVEERGELVGAYVKDPVPGKHKWVCCNDFSSLYPSTIITCNLSVENFIGPMPEEELEKYRKYPNYFVSVMGNVYRNDKDYAFKIIQSQLKTNRATGKYIAKELNARLVSDLEHLLNGQDYDHSEFSQSIQEHLQKMGYSYKYIEDIKNPQEFLSVLKKEITYLVSYEQACKLLGNSMYGGSSHVASSFFNILLANDITGEARNLIKKFEAHLPEFFEKNWYKMTDLHKQLGIQPVTVDGKLVQLVAGDTDSIFSGAIIHTKLYGDIAINELYNKVLEEFPKISITPNGSEIVHPENLKILNWDNRLSYDKVRWISRHRVSKERWKLTTKSGKSVEVTGDHSLIVFRDGIKMEVKPRDVEKTDKICIVKYTQYEFDEIESIECIGMFEDEYVYDLEMENDSHTFIANDILVHNSLYICWDKLVESMNLSSDQERLDALVKLNREFLDSYNKSLMDEYYASRHVKSIHEFELETVAKSGVWLNVKKRYAQALCWQDGRYFDWDSLPIKAKGLEIIKASYPSLGRKMLKNLVETLIKNDDAMETINYMNQEYIEQWQDALPDHICPTSSCKNYDKYVIDDGRELKLEKGIPFVVRGCATYNYTRNKYKLPGEPIYGGKVRYYYCKDNNKNPRVFVFNPSNFQEWMNEYAPIDRRRMYEKCVMEPMNRILEAIGENPLKYDGFMVQDLFGF